MAAHHALGRKQDLETDAGGPASGGESSSEVRFTKWPDRMQLILQSNRSFAGEARCSGRPGSMFRRQAHFGSKLRWRSRGYLQQNQVTVISRNAMMPSGVVHRLPDCLTGLVPVRRVVQTTSRLPVALPMAVVQPRIAVCGEGPSGSCTPARSPPFALSEHSGIRRVTSQTRRSRRPA